MEGILPQGVVPISDVDSDSASDVDSDSDCDLRAPEWQNTTQLEDDGKVYKLPSGLYHWREYKDILIEEAEVLDPSWVCKIPGGGYSVDFRIVLDLSTHIRSEPPQDDMKNVLRRYSSPGEGPQRKVVVNDKQCPIPGVSWSEKRGEWVAKYCLLDGRSSTKRFPVAWYMTAGRTLEEADSEAMRLAVLHRQSLENQGIIKTRRAPSASQHPGHLNRCDVPCSDVFGVTWNVVYQKWHCRIRNVVGKEINHYIKPKDHSPGEVARAFDLAVQWRREKEAEYYDLSVRASTFAERIQRKRKAKAKAKAMKKIKVVKAKGKSK